MKVYATPEEAARAGLPEDCVPAQVVGVVVRGDSAVVAQVVDRAGVPRGDFDTSTPRQVEGGWIPGAGGNGTATFIYTDDETITVVSWCAAPAEAREARYVFLGHEQTFPVADGHVVAAFDDIPFREFWPAEADFPPVWPDLPSEWIAAAE
jgi:hypothetical protein